MLDGDSLGLIADICRDHDLYALSDEIYEKLVYGKEHVSLASLPEMAERTITINGFSKAYAMTGWRIGYAVAPRPILRQMEKVQQHTISHPTTFAMFAPSPRSSPPQDCVETMRREFERRRDYLIPALRDLGYATAPADGAFYAYVQVDGDDMAVAGRGSGTSTWRSPREPRFTPPRLAPPLLRDLDGEPRGSGRADRAGLRPYPFSPPTSFSLPLPLRQPLQPLVVFDRIGGGAVEVDQGHRLSVEGFVVVGVEGENPVVAVERLLAAIQEHERVPPSSSRPQPRGIDLERVRITGDGLAVPSEDEEREPLLYQASAFSGCIRSSRS